MPEISGVGGSTHPTWRLGDSIDRTNSYQPSQMFKKCLKVTDSGVMSKTLCFFSCVAVASIKIEDSVLLEGLHVAWFSVETVCTL